MISHNSQHLKSDGKIKRSKINKKFVFAIIGVTLMLGVTLGTLILYAPGAPVPAPYSNPGVATQPPTTIDNTGYANTSVSYYQNNQIANSGTITVSMPAVANGTSLSAENSPPITADQTSDWSNTLSNPHNYQYTCSFSVGNERFWTNSNSNTVQLDNVVLRLGNFELTGASVNFAANVLCTVYANVTINGHTFSWTASPNYCSSSTSVDAYYSFNPQWNVFSLPAANTCYSTSNVQVTYIATSSYSISAPKAPQYLFSTSADAGSNVVFTQSSLPSLDATGYAIGYHFVSESSTFTLPSDVTSYHILTSNPSYPVSTNYNGASENVGYNYTGNVGVFSITFNPSDPNVNGVTAITANYQLTNIIQAQSESASQSYNAPQDPTQNQNWWNSTLGITLAPPSGAISNTALSTTSGTLNAGTYMTWSINNIISAGYGTGTSFDTIWYSGTDISSGSYNPSSQYHSLSQSTSELIDGSTGISYSFNEGLNYAPNVLSSNVRWTGTSDTAEIYVNVSQVGWTAQGEHLIVSWGNAAATSTSLVQAATAHFTSSFSYPSVGTKSISFSLTNVPDSSKITAASSSVPSQIFVISISPTPTPSPYSQLSTDNSIYLNFSTVHDIVGSVSLSINGVLYNTYSINSASGSIKASPTQIGQTAFTAVWKFDGANYSYSVTYGAPEYPLATSSYLTILYGSNSTHQYPITINSPPSGTGYYQQLLTINNPSQYGINSKGSNIQFASSNGTLLYAWIQSINSTTMQVWVKNYNSSSVIIMQVFPGFENLFSANGYLGENPNINSNYNNWAQMISGESLSTVNANPNEFVGYGSGSGGWENVSGVLRQTELTDNTGGNGAVAVLQDQGAFYNDRSYSLTMTFNYTDISTPPRVGSVSNMYPYGGIGDNGLRAGYRFMMTGNSSTGQAVSFLNDEVGWVQDGDYTTSESTDYTLQVVNVNGTYSYSLYAGQGTTGTLLYSITGVVYSANNRVGDNFGFIGVSDSATSSTYSTGGGSVPMNVTSISISILGAPSVMPTYSIGSGLVFQANATQFTKAFYQTTSSYQPNPLQQIYEYNIYDSFNANYITLLSNSSWQFYSDSGYAQYDSALNALTFDNVSGVGFVQAAYIEPSSQIGTPSFVSISLSADKQSIFNGFSYSLSYVPYDTNQTFYVNGTSSSVQIPFGSNASIKIYNAWGQQVYSKSNILIDQTTMPLPISLSSKISSVSFQFVNTTASQVAISANGITQDESGFSSFFVANNTQYSYSASIFDSSLGKNVNYTGTFTPSSSSKTVYINATAPLAEIIINANAYGGSQLGSLSSSGTDRVILTINNQQVPLGSSFVGFVGQSLSVRISTVLNQTLYSGNILLTLPYQTTTIQIQQPSWNFQVKNGEQVYNTTSPLANEIINLTYIQSTGNTSYITSDMVGNTLSLYLASGSYHIHLHDNATFSDNFTVNKNTYFIVFGQDLLTVTQYNSIIAKVYGNTAGLQVSPINSPSELVQGQKTQLQFQIFYAGGNMAVTGTELQSFLANTTVTVSNSSSSFILPMFVKNNIIYANLTAPSAGGYTISIDGGFNYSGTVVGGHYSYPLNIVSAAADAGLHLFISGATNIMKNQSYTYYLQFEYSNGSALSSASSSSLEKNISVSPSYTISSISPGDYSIVVSSSSLGSLTLIVSGYFMHNGYNLSASAFYPINVASQTSNLVVLPVDTPFSTPVNTTTSYLFKVEYPNGTLLSSSELSSIVSSSSLTMENSAVITPTITLYNSEIYINFTLPTSGYYTLTWTSTLSQGSTTYNLIYSSTVHATTQPVIDNGMHITISGAKSLYAGDSYYYYFILSYDNGTYFNNSNTQSAYSNMTISVYNGGTLISHYTPNIQSNGVIFAEISIPSAYSSLELNATTHLINGVSLSATTYKNINVQSPNTNSQISLIPVDTPSNVLTNSSTSFIYKLQFANGTYLNDAEITTLLSGLEISIMNTNSLAYTTYINGGELYLNTTATSNGYYTISISGSAKYGFSTDSVVYSMTFVSSTIPPIDTGMHIQIIGSPLIAAGTNNSYYLELTYSNGTLFSELNTKEALANLSLTIGSQTIIGSYSSPGIITFIVNEPIGIYLISASTYLNNGVLLKGSSLYPISAEQSTSFLTIVPVDTPNTIPLNTSVPYIFKVQLPNGQYLNSSELAVLAKNMTVTIKNSQTLTYTYAVSGNELYIYFNITSPGYYTFTMNGIYTNNYTVYSYIYSQHVDTQPVVDKGLNLKITGPDVVPVNSSYPYYIMLSFQNGNTLNATETTSAFNNLSIKYLSDGNVISTITGQIMNNGTIEFTFHPTSITLDSSLYITDRIGNDIASAIKPVEIVSPSAELNVIPVDTPSVVLTGSHDSYKFKIEYPNGTLLSSSELSDLINKSTYTLENSADIIPNIAYSGEYVYINFTLPTSGYYTLTWTSTLSQGSTTYNLIYSQSIVTNTTAIGMREQVVIPTLYTNQSANIFVYFFYGNGSLMNKTDTLLAINYTKNVTVYSGNKFIAYLPLSYVSPGKSSAIINLSKTGSYDIVTDTHAFKINNSTVFAASIVPFNVVHSVIPFTSQLYVDVIAFINSILHNLMIWIPITLILAALYYVYRRIRNYIGKDKEDANTVNLALDAEIVNVFSASVQDGMQGLLHTYASLTFAQRNQFMKSPRGLYKNYMIPVKTKNKIENWTLEEVRKQIAISQGNTKIKRFTNDLIGAFSKKKMIKDAGNEDEKTNI